MPGYCGMVFLENVTCLKIARLLFLDNPVVSKSRTCRRRVAKLLLYLIDGCRIGFQKGPWGLVIQDKNYTPLTAPFFFPPRRGEGWRRWPVRRWPFFHPGLSYRQFLQIIPNAINPIKRKLRESVPQFSFLQLLILPGCWISLNKWSWWRHAISCENYVPYLYPTSVASSSYPFLPKLESLILLSLATSIGPHSPPGKNLPLKINFLSCPQACLLCRLVSEKPFFLWSLA